MYMYRVSHKKSPLKEGQGRPFIPEDMEIYFYRGNNSSSTFQAAGELEQEEEIDLKGDFFLGHPVCVFVYVYVNVNPSAFVRGC